MEARVRSERRRAFEGGRPGRRSRSREKEKKNGKRSARNGKINDNGKDRVLSIACVKTA